MTPPPPGRFARPGNVFAIGDNTGGNHNGGRLVTTQVTSMKEGDMTTTNDLKPLLKRLRLGYILNTLPERLALARRDQLDYAAFSGNNLGRRGDQTG